MQTDSFPLPNQPRVLWLDPLCLSTCAQLSPESRLQPQLLAVRALKADGNVAQSLGRDDKLAQRAPYVPKGMGTRQAAQQISNNHLENADTSQKKGYGARGGDQTQRSPDIKGGKS